ncbi:MAG: carboxypeptidase regulatory-like domain-containing protein, partial [Acidobacteriota bacterium]
MKPGTWRLKNGAWHLKPGAWSLTPVFVLLASTVLVAAQSSGAIVGRVTDPSGAVVQGATVTARRLGGAERVTSSDEHGNFYLLGLLPGDWEVAIQASGFQTSQSRAFVHVGGQWRHDTQLEIGLSTVVRVVDAAAASPNSATLSYVVPATAVETMPLNQRDFMGLVALGPGPIPRHLGGLIVDGFTDLQPRRGEVGLNFPINGARANMNAHLLDGASNSDGHIQAFVASPPIDSILEFRVQTSNSSAEFGRMGGGQINVVTRSGTDQWRGSVFEFLRNEKLDARNFFDPPDQKKIPFKQSQFGGNLSGPMPLPDLGAGPVFFFGGYEGLRSRLAHTSLVTVPTAALRSGDFSARRPIFDPASFDASTGRRLPFPSNQIPQGRIDPIARLLLDQFQPLPNRPGDLDNYADSRPQAKRRDGLALRIDHAGSAKDSVFARYTLNDDRDVLPGFFPRTGTLIDLRAQNLVLAHDHVFSSSSHNNWRFGFNRLRLFDVPENAFTNDAVGKLGIAGIDRDPVNFGLPRFDIPGFVMAGDEILLPISQRNNTFHLSDSLSLVRGRH